MRDTALGRAAPPALGAFAGALIGAWALGDGLGAATGAAMGAGLGVLSVRLWLAAPVRRAAAEPGTAATDGQAEDGVLPAGYGRYLLDRIPVGVLLVDRRGRVEFINPTAVRLFGRRPAGAFHVSALRAPRLLEAIDAALGGRRPASVAFSLARGGEVHLKATIQPLTAEAGAGAGPPPVLVLIEDQTQARLAEDLHRDFVANASHELKTPLASISGILETLAGHARDDPQATERFLRLMGGQVERMRRLVEDLLSLNRIEINERVRPEQPQDLAAIVREVAGGFAELADARNMTLETNLPPGPLTVAGDREELKQLFANLVDNAIKYGRPGTAIGIRAREGAADDARIGIAVSDRGEGIAREHLPRLTERFYRVSVRQSRARGGTGLGLAIVKHIVQRHQGELAIESTPGEGSTFTVWLPLLRRPVRAGAPRSDPPRRAG